MAKSPLPFPTSVQRPKPLVERHFYRLSDTRCADRSYHFSVVLPRDWRPLDTPVAPPAEGGGLVTLGLYRASTLVTAEVEIHACILPREVAPAHWLELYVERLGAEVIARRHVDTEGGPVADLLVRTATPDGPLVTRWLAMKNYDHLLVIEGRALEPNYPSTAEAIFMALTSVTLLNPVDWPLAERLKTFSRKLPGDFLVMFPESWALVEDPGNGSRSLQITLKQKVGEVVVGTIVFATVARAAESAPQPIVDRFVADLRGANATLEGLPLTPADPRPGFEQTWTAAGAALLGGAPMEVRAWIGSRPDAWFFAGVFGPARSADPEAWMVHTRAFDIVLRYLKVP